MWFTYSNVISILSCEAATEHVTTKIAKFEDGGYFNTTRYYNMLRCSLCVTEVPINKAE